MEPEGTLRNPGPYGWCYYHSLVRVECGDKTGFFMGGHYDRGDPSPDSDIWIECFCSECKQDPSPGLPGKRILCREFEKHGGRLAAKKYLESIKTIDQGEKRQPLIKWIESKCMEIGHSLVGHKVKVWWPAAGQGKGCYYSGQVTGFDDVRKDHHIHYDDTNEEDLWLAIESWKDLGPIPPPQEPSQSHQEPSQPLHTLRLSPRMQLHMQSPQHSVSQGLQLHPPSPAAEAGYMAEERPKKRANSSRGLPKQSASPKQQRQQLSRSPASSQATDTSPKLAETSGQAHMGNTGSTPMQADPVTEIPEMLHEQSEHVQEHGSSGPFQQQQHFNYGSKQHTLVFRPSTSVTGAAVSVAIPPAERSVNDWEAIFSASNMATFSSEQMLQSIKELLKFMSKRSFGGTFVGKCTNLHDQPGKLARSLKALFQGCSQLFEFVDQRQDTFQMKEMFHDFFATSEFTSSAQ